MKKLIAGGSLFAILFLSLSAEAANKWWDINGATPGSGQGTGTGTWNLTGLDWTTDSTGSSATTMFVSGDLAVFSAGTDATSAWTINSPSGITAAGITVNEGTVSLSGATVTIGTGTVTINSGATLSIPSSAYITATAGATVLLNGGTMQDVNPGSAGSFVSPAMTITLGTGGGTLSYTTANVLNIVSSGTPGTTISGTGPLTKTGAGVLAFATASTYSGATIVNNGELRIRTINNPLPTGTAMTVTSPGILNLNGLSQQVASLTGTGNVGTGSGTLTISGSASTVFNGAILNIANAGASGVTSGNGSLTKSGSGTITFAGVNNIAGTVTLSAGGITVDSGASLCGPTCNLAINGGTLTLDNTAQTVGNLNGSGSTISLGSGNTLTSTAVASASYSGAITGSGNFTYNTPGFVQTLNGTCTYSGNTAITAGTLALGASGSINNSTSLSIAAGATFDVSAIASYTLSGNTTLNAGGASSPATIKGGTTVSLGSQPIILAYDGSHPALTISQGALSLNGNPFTINTASPLAQNTYLIVQQASGSVASSGICTATGTAIGSGTVGYIQVTGGNVNLVVTTLQPGNNTSLVFLGNGTALLSFAGTPGQNYRVQATTSLVPPINWQTLSTILSDSSGLFHYNDLDSVNYTAQFYRTVSP